jgi:hypothetical protein
VIVLLIQNHLDTAFGSDMFGEMHALFGLQRSVMRGRRFRGEADAPAPTASLPVTSAMPPSIYSAPPARFSVRR